MTGLVGDDATRSDDARTAYEGAVLYTVSLGIDAIATFALVIVMTRALTVTEFSQFTLLKVGLAIAALIANVNGIAATRVISEDKDFARRRTIVTTLLVTQFVLSLVIAGIACGIGLLLPEGWMVPMVATSLASVFMVASGGLFDLVRGYGRHRVVAAMVLLDTVVFVGATLLSIYLDGGVTGLMLARVLGTAVTIPIGLYVLRGAIGGRPSMEVARTLFRFGKNTTLYGVLRSLGNADRYVLGWIATLGTAGIFQVATVPVAGLEMIELALIWALEPYLFGLTSERRVAEIRKAFVIVAVGLLAAATVASFGGIEIVSIIAPPSYFDALVLVPWLLAAATARGLTRMIATAAGFTGESRIWAVAAGVELVVSMGLIVPGVWQWGLLGAGIAKLAGAVAGMYVCYYLARGTWPIDLPIHLVSALCIACCVVSTLFATHAVFEPLHLGLRAALALVILVAFALLLLKYRRQYT